MNKVFIILILSFSTISCYKEVTENKTNVQEYAAETLQNELVEKEELITAEYALQQEDTYLTKKCSIIVLLKDKTTENQIKMIAQKIRSEARRDSYNPLFIEYYLPGMKIGSGAYATSHYNPDLKVNILDFMLDENIPEKDVDAAIKIFNKVKADGNRYTFHN